MEFPKSLSTKISFFLILPIIGIFISITNLYFNGATQNSIPVINIIIYSILPAIIYLFFIHKMENMFRGVNIKKINTIILGLFFGIILASGISKFIGDVISLINIENKSHLFLTLSAIKLLIYTTSIHFTIFMSLTYEKTIAFSLPFIKLNNISKQKNGFILDETILLDPRILDFCATGILNNRLIIPKFIINKYSNASNSDNDHISRALNTIEQLKSMNELNLEIEETDFNDCTDVKKKIQKLAKMLSCDILVSENSNNETHKELKYINLNYIASTLKNTMTAGEHIQIKIQRFGKEPQQGVGYLEDGTMVVVNNGGDYVGEIIDTQVISIKQTSAGRIIFTNAVINEESDYSDDRNIIYEHQHD